MSTSSRLKLHWLLNVSIYNFMFSLKKINSTIVSSTFSRGTFVGYVELISSIEGQSYNQWAKGYVLLHTLHIQLKCNWNHVLKSQFLTMKLFHDFKCFFSCVKVCAIKTTGKLEQKLHFDCFGVSWPSDFDYKSCLHYQKPIQLVSKSKLVTLSKSTCSFNLVKENDSIRSS